MLIRCTVPFICVKEVDKFGSIFPKLRNWDLLVIALKSSYVLFISNSFIIASSGCSTRLAEALNPQLIPNGVGGSLLRFSICLSCFHCHAFVANLKCSALVSAS